MKGRAKVDKFNADAIKFKEWQIAREQVVRFQGVLRDSKRVIGDSKLRVHAIGSPRRLSVISILNRNGHKFRKVIRVDIRDGSCEDWLPKFDVSEWELIDHH